MTTDAKLLAFEALMTEISAALADLVDAAQQKKSSADEISNTLVDILEVMRKPPAAAAVALQEIRQEAPVVNVENKITVAPTPVKVVNEVTCTPTVQILPGTQRDADIKFSYDSRGRIESGRVTFLSSSKS